MQTIILTQGLTHSSNFIFRLVCAAFLVRGLADGFVATSLSAFDGFGGAEDPGGSEGSGGSGGVVVLCARPSKLSSISSGRSFFAKTKSKFVIGLGRVRVGCLRFTTFLALK